MIFQVEVILWCGAIECDIALVNEYLFQRAVLIEHVAAVLVVLYRPTVRVGHRQLSPCRTVYVVNHPSILIGNPRRQI